MVDGFIFATAVPGSDHILKLKQSSFPVVLVSRIMGDEVDAVGVDNFKGLS
jgi:DNA-binding LacI/PurR family transcriptional regulator